MYEYQKHAFSFRQTPQIVSPIPYIDANAPETYSLVNNRGFITTSKADPLKQCSPS